MVKLEDTDVAVVPAHSTSAARLSDQDLLDLPPPAADGLRAAEEASPSLAIGPLGEEREPVRPAEHLPAPKDGSVGYDWVSKPGSGRMQSMLTQPPPHGCRRAIDADRHLGQGEPFGDEFSEHAAVHGSTNTSSYTGWTDRPAVTDKGNVLDK
jgi:hypothetical protein